MAERAPARRSWMTSFVSLLAISLLLASCGGGDTATGSQNDESDGGEPVVEALAIFIEVGCAECHGEQGEGVDGKGASLQGTRMIYNAFETRVRNGRGQQMPAFSEDEISAEEISILHEWFRTH